MTYEFSVAVQGVRHGVKRYVHNWAAPGGSTYTIHVGCGGYVNDPSALPEGGFIVVTCVACLAAAKRFVSLPGVV